MICDRSGFTFYASEMRKEWTGAWVHKDYWEPKNAQLEIKAKKDEQAVPNARPSKSEEFGSTTTSAGSSKSDKTITLTSVADIAWGTGIGITLDSGAIQWSFSTGDPAASVVTINEGLEDDVASGNTVYVSSVSDENYVTLSDSEREAAL